MTISSLLDCGPCTGVLSEALRYLLPGEGTAPANVSVAETTSQLQKVVLDPISGLDLSRHADPVRAVHYKSDCDVGRESPQDYRGVSFIPRPPSCSLASSSGPPFIPYSSGEGWDVMDTMSQIRLGSWWDFRDEFLRIPWDPLYQEDPLWWSWAIQQREGVDLSLPVPDLPSRTSPRHSNGTTLTSRSDATTAFPSVSRRSPFSSSDDVAPLKRFASQADFSETVAGHLALCRRNSRLNGQARGGMFRKWCRIFHYWSSEPSIP